MSVLFEAEKVTEQVGAIHHFGEHLVPEYEGFGGGFEFRIGVIGLSVGEGSGRRIERLDVADLVESILDKPINVAELVDIYF